MSETMDLVQKYTSQITPAADRLASSKQFLGEVSQHMKVGGLYDDDKVRDIVKALLRVTLDSTHTSPKLRDWLLSPEVSEVVWALATGPGTASILRGMTAAISENGVGWQGMNTWGPLLANTWFRQKNTVAPTTPGFLAEVFRFTYMCGDRQPGGCGKSLLASSKIDTELLPLVSAALPKETGESINQGDSDGNTVLHQAASLTEVSKKLLTHKEINVNARNNTGHTPLIKLIAATKTFEDNDFPPARLLLEDPRTDVTILDSDSKTVLDHCLGRVGDAKKSTRVALKMIKLICKHQSVSPAMLNTGLEFLLSWEAPDTQLTLYNDVIVSLVENDKHNINTPLRDGMTACHMAAASKGNDHLVLRLINNDGFDSNVQDDLGNTVLHYLYQNEKQAIKIMNCTKVKWQYTLTNKHDRMAQDCIQALPGINPEWVSVLKQRTLHEQETKAAQTDSSTKNTELLAGIVKENNWGERDMTPMCDAESVTLKIRSKSLAQIHKLHGDYETGRVRDAFCSYVEKLDKGADKKDVMVVISQEDLHSVYRFHIAETLKNDIEWTYCKKTERWYWKAPASGQWNTSETAVILVNDVNTKPMASDVETIANRHGIIKRDDTPETCAICPGGCHPAVEEIKGFFAFDGITISLSWNKKAIYWKTITNQHGEEERMNYPPSDPMSMILKSDDLTQKYKMGNNIKGLACIIAMHLYRDDKDKKKALKGYVKDTEDLTKLWKDLGFIVKIPENRARNCLTAIEIETAVKEFAGQLIRSDQCAVLCISSHGNAQFVYGGDREKVRKADLCKELINTNCIQMAGKPKLVFIQACQGGLKDSGQVFLAGADTDPGPPEHTRTMHLPRFSDLIIGTASFPGSISTVTPHGGSVYMQKLVKIFAKYARTENIDTLLRMVNYAVGEECVTFEERDEKIDAIIGWQVKQMPEIRSTLRKELFFSTIGDGVEDAP